MHKLILAFVIASCFVLASAFSAITIPSAYASTRIPEAKKCVVTLYYLHGHKPATSKCAQWGDTSGKGIRPNTGTVSCGSYYPIVSLIIESTQNGTACFAGSGYLGFSMGGVYAVDYIYYGGWVFYYHQSYTGYRYYMTAGQSVVNRFPFDGKDNITQVCIYDDFGGGC